MELRDYLRILWRRRWLIALAIATAAGSALGFSSRIVPVYEATATIFVGPRTAQTTDLTSAFEELSFSGEFLASYAELLKSRSLAEKVVEKESLQISATELRRTIETSIVANTRIITLSITDTDPDRVQRVANTLVDTFIAEDLEDFGGRAGVQANVLDPALRPTAPIKPKPLQNGLIGAVLGLVLGLSIAFLLEQFDTTLRSREDVERALAPLAVLATIPAVPNVERDLLLDSNSKTPAAEAFRILRTNVQFFSVERPVSKILVAGSGTEEGKTTVAMNLAAGFALGGVPTIFIETDLRRPVVHKYFNIKGTPGISDVLLGKATLEEALVKTRIPDLRVLPAGTSPPNPSELLGTKRIEEIIRYLEREAAMLIFDTPPALAMSDAYVLAPFTDGVIMVVRAGKTHREGARETKAAFERLGARLLGLVWNGAEASDVNYYYRYYHHYSEPEVSKGRGGRKKSAELLRPEASPAAVTVKEMVVTKNSGAAESEKGTEERELFPVQDDVPTKDFLESLRQPQIPKDPAALINSPPPVSRIETPPPPKPEPEPFVRPEPSLPEPPRPFPVVTVPAHVESRLETDGPRVSSNWETQPPTPEPSIEPELIKESDPVPFTRPESTELDGKYDGYCVHCRMNREFVGEEIQLYGGLRSAQGPCPECDSPITVRLPRQALSKE